MSKENTPVNITGLTLENPVMNGAGPVKLAEHVLELANSHASAIVLGSITINERQGNSGDTYYVNPESSYSLNSRGLPNPGPKYFL